jgi:hypothetical protein
MGSMARYPATKRRISSDSVHSGNCSYRLAIRGLKRHDVERFMGAGGDHGYVPVIGI